MSLKEFWRHQACPQEFSGSTSYFLLTNICFDPSFLYFPIFLYSRCYVGTFSVTGFLSTALLFSKPGSTRHVARTTHWPSGEGFGTIPVSVLGLFAEEDL